MKDWCAHLGAIAWQLRRVCERRGHLRSIAISTTYVALTHDQCVHAGPTTDVGPS